MKNNRINLNACYNSIKTYYFEFHEIQNNGFLLTEKLGLSAPNDVLDTIIKLQVIAVQRYLKNGGKRDYTKWLIELPSYYYKEY